MNIIRGICCYFVYIVLSFALFLNAGTLFEIIRYFLFDKYKINIKKEVSAIIKRYYYFIRSDIHKIILNYKFLFLIMCLIFIMGTIFISVPCEQIGNFFESENYSAKYFVYVTNYEVNCLYEKAVAEITRTSSESNYKFHYYIKNFCLINSKKIIYMLDDQEIVLNKEVDIEDKKCNTWECELTDKIAEDTITTKDIMKMIITFSIIYSLTLFLPILYFISKPKEEDLLKTSYKVEQEQIKQEAPEESKKNTGEIKDIYSEVLKSMAEHNDSDKQ